MHVVLIKFKSGISKPEIDQLEEKLKRLKSVIREIISLNVGRNVISAERAFDYGVVASFKDLDSLGKYQGHAEHDNVKEFLKPMCAQIVSVDFTC
jgi:hypothetical protein